MHRIMFVMCFGLFSVFGLMSLLHCNGESPPTDGVVADGSVSETPDSSSAVQLSFPAVTATACACTAGEKYAAPHAPEIDDAAEAIATSPDGKYLAVSTKLTVYLYERSGADELFKAQRQKAVLPQAVWALRFSPDSKHLAIVMDKQVRVWSVAKAIEDPKDAGVLEIDAPSGTTLAADAVFFSDDILAAAFLGGTTKDPIQLWSLSGDKPKQILTLDVPSVQSLAVAPSGGFLVVGGQDSAADKKLAMFTVFQLKGDATSLSMSARQVIKLNQVDSFVTALAVSPDNKFIAAGTSPDLSFQRGTPKRAPAGDHGFVSVWPTSPLKPDTGFVLVQNKNSDRTHSILVRSLAFRSDGQILSTIGVGSPKTGVLLHLWRRQDDAAAPFALADELMPITPGRQMTMGPACHFVLATSSVEPFVQMWKGCL